MELHLGRLFDHVQINVADLDASKRFYEAVLKVLGLGIVFEAVTPDGRAFFTADELVVMKGTNAPSARVHLAFQAKDRETIQRFHEAALRAGGRDNGAPGERPYHPGYYAAYALDPDGNNVEVVHHGPAVRSASSVVVRPVAP